MRPRLPDIKATPAVAFCFFANHVLDGAAWARARLARFAGRAVEFRAPLAPAVLATINAQGRLEPGGSEPPAASVWLGPQPKASGEAELSAELEALARTLRWDAEEDLSRLTGDVLAHRLMQGARALEGWSRDAAERLGVALGAYAVDEARLVAGASELHELAASIERLSQALDELEARAARLV